MIRLIIPAMVVSLSACSSVSMLKKQAGEPQSQTVSPTVSESSDLTGNFSRSKLIAADFATIMVQLPELDPNNTIISTAKPSSRFGSLLLLALQNAGYDLRVGNKQSSNWLEYDVNRDGSSSLSGNPVFTFYVSSGQVKLKRSYEVDSITIKPVSSMYVLGATADQVVMDNSIFLTPVETNDIARTIVKRDELDEDSSMIEISAVPVVQAPIKQSIKQPVLAAQSANTIVAKASSVKSDEVKIVARSSVDNSNGNDYAKVPNMYETRVSIYQQQMQDYSELDKHILLFPNDSLIMGKTNKVLIRQLEDRFNPSTDIISVIGCSHGKTTLKNGNAYLAIQRAERVKEELVLVGVDAHKVLSEGCWANKHFDKMPSRGVVVSHRRKQG